MTSPTDSPGWFGLFALRWASRAPAHEAHHPPHHQHPTGDTEHSTVAIRTVFSTAATMGLNSGLWPRSPSDGLTARWPSKTPTVATETRFTKRWPLKHGLVATVTYGAAHLRWPLSPYTGHMLQPWRRRTRARHHAGHTPAMRWPLQAPLWPLMPPVPAPLWPPAMLALCCVPCRACLLCVCAAWRACAAHTFSAEPGGLLIRAPCCFSCLRTSSRDFLSLLS